MMISRARVILSVLVVAAALVVACGRSEAPQPPPTEPLPGTAAIAATPPDPQPTPSPTVTLPVLKTISGEVFYRERLRLPSDAELTVTLVRLGGSGGRVIAKSTVRPRQQVPIPFELEYGTADINRGASYGIEVEITRRDDVVFVLPEPVPVITGGAPETGLKLLLRRNS